jgi:hypothetical protein
MESISHTKGSDLGRELKITNGAAARWVDEKDGRKKEREEEEREREGSHILPVSRAIVTGMTPTWVAPPNMARLDQHLMGQPCQSR